MAKNVKFLFFNNVNEVFSMNLPQYNSKYI